MIIVDLDKIRVNQDLFCGDSSWSGSDVGIGVVTDLSTTGSESSLRNYTISPGGNRYYIPSCVVENGVPYTNQVFESVEQGFNNPKDDPKVLKKRRSVTRRCGCKAKMVLKRNLKPSIIAYDVDSDDLLTKIFWADSIGRRNFELHGDSISFDATFDTNRYNLICTPFTGIDNMTDVFTNKEIRYEFWLHFESAMDKQRNETEKILASCLEMQIKRMSEEVDGVTHFEIRDLRVKDKLFKVCVSMNHVMCSCKKIVMCGIVCRHAFCGLKQIRVTKFPRSLVLNRWMQTTDSGTSSNLDVVTSDYFKMEQISLKLTTIWFNFRQSVDKAGVEMDSLEHVHITIKKLNTWLDDCDGSIVSFRKNDHIAAMVRQQHEGEVNILPPNVCKNKGNYFKRLMSDRKK
ncbi:uncharacterized protein LOC141685355 [Apium graveolens]|uniref:uncharacterized protein LOC141685355 n=1 Tax=Apium graveolens TaxID=4045 RepID=UPI003D7A440B